MYVVAGRLTLLPCLMSLACHACHQSKKSNKQVACPWNPDVSTGRHKPVMSIANRGCTGLPACQLPVRNTGLPLPHQPAHHNNAKPTKRQDPKGCCDALTARPVQVQALDSSKGACRVGCIIGPMSKALQAGCQHLHSMSSCRTPPAFFSYCLFVCCIQCQTACLSGPFTHMHQC